MISAYLRSDRILSSDNRREWLRLSALRREPKNMTEVRLPSDWVQFLNVRDFLVWVDNQGIDPEDWDVRTDDGSLDLILSFQREEYATLFKLKFGYGALH